MDTIHSYSNHRQLTVQRLIIGCIKNLTGKGCYYQPGQHSKERIVIGTLIANIGIYWNCKMTPIVKLPMYGAMDESQSTGHIKFLSAKDAPTLQPNKPKRGIVISTPLAIGMANLAGILGIMQTGTNASLRREFFPNPIATCGISFLVGLLTMVFICLVDDAKLPKIAKIGDCPWYLFIGGVLGGIYKTAAIILAPRIGFATFHIAAVSGQLIAGVLCDLVGFLHLKPTHPTPFKVLCASVVLVGAALSTDNGIGNNIREPDSPANSKSAIFAIVACLAGSVLPIQALMNFKLGENIGTTFHAVTVNFLVGSMAMWAVVGLEDVLPIVESKPILEIQDGDGRDEWWMWTGGSMGAILIVCVTLSLPMLGAAKFSLIFTSTQLVSALIADTIGAFGFTPIPLDASSHHRIFGVVLATLAAAVCDLKFPAWLRILNEWPSDGKPTPKDTMPVPLSPVIICGKVRSESSNDEHAPKPDCHSPSSVC